jgi:Tub family
MVVEDGVRSYSSMGSFSSEGLLSMDAAEAGSMPSYDEDDAVPTMQGLPDIPHTPPASDEAERSNKGDLGEGARDNTPSDDATAKASSISHWINPPSATKNPAESAAPKLLSLPVDSLHNVASFLTPNDWFLNFGSTSKASLRVVREIGRRVQIHAFRCATEVVTAWKCVGEHADARALVALYISSGVPIYPHVMGHSFRTLLWRMQVEADALRQDQTPPPSSTDGDTSGDQSDGVDENPPTTPSQAASTVTLDPFWDEFAADSRSFEYSGRSYLEIKTCFQFGLEEEQGNDTLTPAVGSTNRVDPQAASRPSPRAPSSSNTRMSNAPSIPSVVVHQHLYDQHMQGAFSVSDHDGGVSTPPVSLSADFFHASSYRYPASAKRAGSTATSSSATSSTLGNEMQGIAAVAPLDGALSREFLREATSNLATRFTDFADILAGLDDSIGSLPLVPKRLSDERIHKLLKFVKPETYTSSRIAHTSCGRSDSRSVQKHLCSRFSTYERRLESFLANRDKGGFDECLLDFWDEFFPRTAMILYHDRHTAVPRISCLHKFLTTPLSKALGTIQCEIERIKTTNSGKGVTMTGRLFPTYEYRLFIRHRPHDDPSRSIHDDDEDDDEQDQRPTPRRDTVLMVARNKGRKYSESSSSVPIVSSSVKKGSNNYYLYMPQQNDIDSHYTSVNRLTEPRSNCPNGVGDDLRVDWNDPSRCMLLGRLQSNFIGTEFEIFVPQVRKRIRRKDEGSLQPLWDHSRSDDELDYECAAIGDSSTSIDTASRRNRFRLLSLRRSHALAEPAPLEAGDHSDNESTGERSRSLPRRNGRIRRSQSVSDIQSNVKQTRATRPNRRAIANNAVEKHHDEPTLYEEEDGAITYTANLLGSRPRIMDVCIPRVTEDGVRGADWKAYVKSCDDPDECRLLHCLRERVQQLENMAEQPPNNNVPNGRVDGAAGGRPVEAADLAVTATGVNATDAPAEVSDDFGLLALQNRPPWWNVELGSFVLNFGGRVSVASVKNFQLCDRGDQETILLQFGRIQGRHSFTMDYQHPLTAVQAFSIAISSLQSKISFG